MAEFVCGVREKNPKYLSACKSLPEYRDTGYCVLHFPGEEKREDFEQVRKDKLEREDYDFSGTVFPEGTSDFEGFVFDANTIFAGDTFTGEANFSEAQFSSEWYTDFTEAQFNGERTKFDRAQFSAPQTDFSGAQFSSRRTNFREARFSGWWSIDFSEAQISGVTSFGGAQFSGMEADFSRARFSDVTDFTEAQFNGELTDFNGAQFSGTHTDFSEAQFSSRRTDFTAAQFNGEEGIFFLSAQFSSERTIFSRAQFSGGSTLFTRAQFSPGRTSFNQVQFSGTQTSFYEATFSEVVYFARSTFKEKAFFWGSNAYSVFGPEAWAWFYDCRIEKPELLTFNTVLLHPGWFIETDVRKVDFTNVQWYGMPGGPEGTLGKEIAELTRRKVESPHTELAQACRRLSANAEDNREYPLANELYYWSMDALRKESWDYRRESWDNLVWIRKNWLRVAKRCGPATTLRVVWGRIWRRHRSRPRNFGFIITLYWAMSGYGVRAARAFLMLVGICTVFAVLYMLLGPNALRVSSVSSIGQALEHVGQAVVYSLSTMARLNPEPKPTPGLFQFLVTIEGILGPLQIALLALAVRRKVMR